jgi:hypothetical protein
MSMIFNANDFGVYPTNKDDNVNIQAFLDKVEDSVAKYLAKNNGAGLPRAVAYFPQGVNDHDQYMTSKTLRVGNGVCIRGDGPQTVIWCTNGYPAVMVGLPRSGVNSKADFRFRPDVYGYLDTSVVKSSGQKWGFSPGPDGAGFVQSMSSSFSLGGNSSINSNLADHWIETRKFTFEVAVMGTGVNGVVDEGYICSIGIPSYQAENTNFVFMSRGNDIYEFWYSLQKQRLGPATRYVSRINLAGASGTRKIAFTMDFDAGLVTAYDGTKQLDITGNTTLPKDSFLNENHCRPFYLFYPAWLVGKNIQCNVFGMSMSRSAKYNNSGVGSPQTRPDSKPINDANRFYGKDDPSLIGYFNFGENPATNETLLQITGGRYSNGVSTAAFIIFSNNEPNCSTHNTIEDIYITSGSMYGTAVMRYWVLEQTFKNCYLSGGSYGIADFVFGANYNNYISNCYVNGYESAILSYYGSIYIDTITFPNNGRQTVRCIGSNVVMDKAFVTAVGSNADGFFVNHAGEYGGSVTISNVLYDDEGSPPYNIAALAFEQNPYMISTVDLKNISLQYNGDSPLIVLTQKGNPPTYPTASCTIDNVGGDYWGNGLVQVNGPGWVVNATKTGGDYASPVVNIGEFPGPTRVNFQIDSYRTPLKYGSTIARTVTLNVIGPADGQPSRIIPVSSGQWGANPPLWLAEDVCQSNPNTPVVFNAVGHTSISVSGDGFVSTWGHIGTYNTTNLTAYLMGGTSNPIPSSWPMGLSTSRATMASHIADQPTLYQKANVPNTTDMFVSPQYGKIVNSAPIVIGPVNTEMKVRSLFMGNAIIDLGKGVTLASGQSLTIPVSGLVIQHSPLSGTWGGLTDTGWDRVYRYIFGGRKFTPPKTWAFRLSTTPVDRTGVHAQLSVTAPIANNTNNFSMYGPINNQYGDMMSQSIITWPTPKYNLGLALGSVMVDENGLAWAYSPLHLPIQLKPGMPPTMDAFACIISV